jgi:hypothetical protein
LMIGWSVDRKKQNRLSLSQGVAAASVIALRQFYLRTGAPDLISDPCRLSDVLACD